MDGAFCGAAIKAMSTLATTIATNPDWKRIEVRSGRNRASFNEIMADPITRLLMQADGVCPDEVVQMVEKLRDIGNRQTFHYSGV